MRRALIGTLAATGLLATAGYLATQPPRGAPVMVAPAQAAERQPLYYRDPMGKPDYSPVPKKDAMGMDYVAVYEEEEAKPAPEKKVESKPTPPPVVKGAEQAPIKPSILSSG